MTIERQRQLVLYRGYDRDYAVRIPGTKRRVQVGQQFSFTETQSSRGSFFEETIRVGTLNTTDEVTVLADDKLGLDVKNKIDIDPTVAVEMGDLLSPDWVAKNTPVNRRGEIKGDKINDGLAFPPSARLQTVFRYKPSK